MFWHYELTGRSETARDHFRWMLHSVPIIVFQTCHPFKPVGMRNIIQKRSLAQTQDSAGRGHPEGAAWLRFIDLGGQNAAYLHPMRLINVKHGRWSARYGTFALPVIWPLRIEIKIINHQP